MKMSDQTIEIISMLVSCIALVLSVFTFQRARTSAVITFFTQGDSAEMKKSRCAIYEIYDFWALMVKKHYLPKWTFQDSAKYTAKNVYRKILPYIIYRREEQPLYASHFEWLIKKLG